MLPKKHRLTKEKDFQEVFGRGKIFSERFIVVKLAPNGLAFSRFGIAAGLRISKKAVDRNKIKRQISEILRMEWNNVRQGFDVIILPKKEIVGASYEEIKKTTRSALLKAGILEQK